MEPLPSKRKRYIGPYILGRTIGEGASAIVKLGRHKQTKERVAIKIVSKGLISTEALEQIKSEISILRILEHPQIVAIKDVFNKQDKIFIIMEYLKRGDLFTKILTEGPLEEQAAKRLFQQLLDALHHCHQNSVFHRDLKPENILLTGDGDVKLSDFGLATFINQLYDKYQLLWGFRGTINYAPPEALSKNGYHGAPADIWSLGVVLYVILVGRLPFLDRSFPRLCEKIQSGFFTIPTHLSEDVRNLLQRMIFIDPNKRITILEIMEHSWMRVNALDSKSCVIQIASHQELKGEKLKKLRLSPRQRQTIQQRRSLNLPTNVEE